MGRSPYNRVTLQLVQSFSCALDANSSAIELSFDLFHDKSQRQVLGRNLDAKICRLNNDRRQGATCAWPGLGTQLQTC